jgi:hypothetical protein
MPAVSDQALQSATASGLLPSQPSSTAPGDCEAKSPAALEEDGPFSLPPSGRARARHLACDTPASPQQHSPGSLLAGQPACSSPSLAQALAPASTSGATSSHDANGLSAFNEPCCTGASAAQPLAAVLASCAQPRGDAGAAQRNRGRDAGGRVGRQQPGSLRDKLQVCKLFCTVAVVLSGLPSGQGLLSC